MGISVIIDSPGHRFTNIGMYCKKGLFFSLFMICLCLQAQDTLKIVQRLGPVNFYIKLHESVYPVLLDVRTWKEYRKSRIPGAHLAENKVALTSFTDTLDKYQPLFLYCESETRSDQVVAILEKEGFKRIFILKGGFSGWVRQGYETDNKRIKKSKRKFN